MGYVIYIHRNKINNKVYVGQTGQQVNQRWRNGKGYANNSLFYRAIEKYGWDNFDHDIIFTGLDKEQANRLEIETISLFDSNNPDKGYNLTEGGQGTNGYHLTEEHKKHISEIQTGRLLTEEWKQHISEAVRGENHPFYGKKLSDEHRKHLSESHMGQKPAYGMLGKKHSEETKKKMSEARKGRKFSEESIQKIKDHYNQDIKHVDTGNVYHTAVQASEATGCPVHGIYGCCGGRQKTTLGQKFEYVERN